MRLTSDYKGMFSTTISDREIERLLTGSPTENGELSDLAVFVEMMRAYDTRVPSDQAVDRLAIQAARLARAGRSSAAATSASSDRPPLRRRVLRPQIAAAAVAILMITGATGVAAAADAAAPGDSLYGLDRALERIGIGAGSAEERLEEANQLLAEGKTRQALEHATEALDEDDDEAARAALDIAIEGVETAGDQNATVVQEKVGALLTYMSQNIGKGVGADGREFGQGVAELAHGITPPDATDDLAPIDTPPPGNDNKPDDNGEPGNGNEGASNQGTESGNSNAPGNGTNPGTGSNQGGGNANPPGKNGNGPAPDSPSVTAPGRGNRP